LAIDGYLSHDDPVVWFYLLYRKLSVDIKTIVQGYDLIKK